MRAERIVKTGHFKNTNKDKLKFIDAVLVSGVQIGSLSAFPSIVYFSVYSIIPKQLERFALLSGIELEDNHKVQVNFV